MGNYDLEGGLFPGRPMRVRKIKSQIITEPIGEKHNRYENLLNEELEKLARLENSVKGGETSYSLMKRRGGLRVLYG